jgi:hypothetical protein
MREIVGEDKAKVNLFGNYPLTVGIKSRYVDARVGSDEVHYLNPPKDINMRVSDRVLTCVGFFSYDNPKIKYGGTGFVVGVRGLHDNAYLHLVTAQHVAENFEDAPWVFGINLKSGGKVLIKGTPEDAKWWYHPTDKEHVDAAVAILATDKLSDYDLHWLPETMLLDDESIEKHGIGIGDEVNVVGLFTRFHGQQRHIPIIRTGNIAMMPTEPVPTRKYSPMEAYLAEGRSIGGLSGSPVFVRETINMEVADGSGGKKYFYGQGNIYLLGLMHGHWDVDLKKTEQIEAVNLGVSIVVPAKKIREILYHPELVALRKAFDDAIAKEKEPVTDSELGKPEESFTKEEFEASLKKVSRKVKT